MIDHEKIEQAVRLLLEGMGEDVTREGLKDTPDRIARMYEEIYGGMDEDAGVHLAKTFTVDSSEMVIEKDITFYSTCEHHLLPFYGKAHIAYIPDGKVVGLSKLARTVEVFARRLQLQEQLTGQIADALMQYMCPKGAMVMVEAEHMCMTMRGIKKPGSQTVTIARRGVFETDPALEERFFPDAWEIDEMVKRKLMEHAEKEQKMERLNTVLRHPLYQQYYKELREEERDRIFCCHQMEHLLDVARIAYIRNLENNLGYSKELLYTTAILHDIGKALQYKEKIPHEIAGAQIAEKILDSLPEAVSYTEEEKKEILTAIRGHRRERKDMTKLERLLYESDKCSRNCFACPAKKECNWSEEKKNREIQI